MFALLALALMPMALATPAFAAQLHSFAAKPMSAMHCQDMGQDEGGKSSPQPAQDMSHRPCIACSMILSPPAAMPVSALIQGDRAVAPLVAALDDGPLAVEPPPPR